MSNRTRNACATAAALLCTIVVTGFGSGDKPEAPIAVGKEYVTKGDFKAVVLQFKNALQKTPHSAEGNNLLGKPAKSAPDLTGIRFNSARALAKAGKKAEGKLELGELAKLGEKFPDQVEAGKLLREL